MKTLIDRYSFNARFLPAAVVLLPTGIAAAAWLPQRDQLISLGQVLAIAASAGGSMLLAQLGRNLGKFKEPGLFQRWGGQPTSVRLRHAQSPNRSPDERMLPIDEASEPPCVAWERHRHV